MADDEWKFDSTSVGPGDALYRRVALAVLAQCVAFDEATDRRIVGPAALRYDYDDDSHEQEGMSVHLASVLNERDRPIEDAYDYDACFAAVFPAFAVRQGRGGILPKEDELEPDADLRVAHALVRSKTQLSQADPRPKKPEEWKDIRSAIADHATWYPENGGHR